MNKNFIYHIDKLYKLIFRIEAYQNSSIGNSLPKGSQSYLNEAKDKIREAIKKLEE